MKTKTVKHYLKSGKHWTLCGRPRAQQRLEITSDRDNVTCKICRDAIRIWEGYRELRTA